jgi:hypothetical protein
VRENKRVRKRVREEKINGEEEREKRKEESGRLT